MSTIKDITQWWKKYVSDKIQLTLSLDRVDDWHQEQGKLEGGLIVWVCPHGLYEVFALVPQSASGEYLDDGTDNQLVLEITDTAPAFPHNVNWWPADVTLALNSTNDPAIYICKKPQGWIMSTGQKLRNNNTGNPFTVRYRKLR